MIETALVEYLKSLNLSCGFRIYPELLPQNELVPAITYHKDGESHDYAFDGHIGLIPVEFQIDCWGDTYAAAKGLFKLLYDDLKNFRFQEMGGVWVNQVFITGSADIYEKTPELYRSSLSCKIVYRE